MNFLQAIRKFNKDNYIIVNTQENFQIHCNSIDSLYITYGIDGTTTECVEEVIHALQLLSKYHYEVIE